MTEAAAATASAALTQGADGAQTTQATQAQGKWFDSFADDLKAYTANKGWDDPAKAVHSYRDLEKFLGADKAGRGVVLPKEDAAPEEWAAFYNKLGRPDNPDGYKLPVPEGDGGQFAKVASGWFHELGLTAKQAASLAEKWNGYAAETMKAAQEAQIAERSKQAEADLTALKQEWGADYDKRVELGRRAAREYGIDADTLDKMESALGSKQVLSLMAKIGAAQTEHEFVGGGKGAGFGATPLQAKGELMQLREDRDFMKRLNSGEKQAAEKWNRLNRLANGAA